MNHVLIGAAFPFVVAVGVYLWRRCRAGLVLLLTAPLAMAACALWASAPDLPRLVGWDGLYLRLSMNPRINIFFWHDRIDQVETESSWYAVGVALMAACLMAAALRQLFLEERR
jgi:hypothetical protein